MRRIESLTGEQVRLLPGIRDEWLEIGLKTGPADRKEAERGVAEAYRAAGLKPSEITIWLDSPVAGAIGAAMLRHELRSRPGRPDQVGAQVRDQVGAQVRAQVRDQVGAQVWDQVWDQVGAQVGAQVYQACYGAHDAAWLSFYAAMRRLGVADTKRLDGLMGVARSCGWWWPYEGAVILTERPVELHRDEENRLHSDAGAAILYPDGLGVWAHHGVRVPRRVIEAPDSLTAHEITNERNVEVRRIMMERYGADRYLSESAAQLMDDSAEWGKLWRIDFSDDEPLVMVEVVNSTPEPDGSFRNYMLRVPPECDTARGAVAWTFGLDSEVYVPAEET